ncbi:hypothetical protein M0R45_031178 [Rubus argutus]|uniref:Uncharacterized protein n=1 Tax=Rubus argutus TaxID=59490 RepID=A0AAW1WFP0_RUBAR
MDLKNIRFLLDDLQELKPTMFCIVSKVSSGGVLRKTLFQYAYNYKLANLEKGLPQEKAAPLLDKLVFDKIKQALIGGRVCIMLSGVVPLPRHVEEFFRVMHQLQHFITRIWYG